MNTWLRNTFSGLKIKIFTINQETDDAIHISCKTVGWNGLGCKIKGNCLHVGPRPSGSALWGSFSKKYQPVIMLVTEKITENSERLGRQARPGNKPGMSRLPVLRTEPLDRWWDSRLWRGYKNLHFEKLNSLVSKVICKFSFLFEFKK